MEHRYAGDDRCVCGAMAVYYEDPDDDGYCGEGCEASGRVWPTVRQRQDDLERELVEAGNEAGRPSLADWNVTILH